MLRTVRRGGEASVAGADAFGAFIDSHVADPVWEPASRVEYEGWRGRPAVVHLREVLLCLSQDQRVAYLLGDLLGFSDAGAAEICEITRAAFRQRLARAQVVMRTLMAERCGLVAPATRAAATGWSTPVSTVGCWTRSIPGGLAMAGVTLPIETTTVDMAAARELDLAMAAAEECSAPTRRSRRRRLCVDDSPAPFPLCSATGDRTPRGGVARVSVAGGG